MNQFGALLFVSRQRVRAENSCPVYRLCDIAHGLSRIASPDFSRFYSFAQRSVLVSLHAEGRAALDLLMHWSPLAYYPVVAWAKNQRDKEYKELEKRLVDQFGYVPQLSFLGLVVDQRLRATERRDLLDGGSLWEGTTRVEPFKEQIIPWGPLEAEERFHERYKELTR